MIRAILPDGMSVRVMYPRYECILHSDGTELRREIWPDHERCWINGRLVNSIIYKAAKNGWKRQRQRKRKP